jgi:hypothetical protein
VSLCVKLFGSSRNEDADQSSSPYAHAEWQVPARVCGREDSNLHPFQDQDLNLARLPVSPRPHWNDKRSSSDEGPNHVG